MKGKIPDGPAEQSARGARQAHATPLRAAYRSAPLICLAYVSVIACYRVYGGCFSTGGREGRNCILDVATKQEWREEQRTQHTSRFSLTKSYNQEFLQNNMMGTSRLNLCFYFLLIFCFIFLLTFFFLVTILLFLFFAYFYFLFHFHHTNNYLKKITFPPIHKIISNGRMAWDQLISITGSELFTKFKRRPY